MENFGLTKTTETQIFWGIPSLIIWNEDVIGFSSREVSSTFLINQQNQISKILELLNIENPVVFEIANDVVLELNEQGKGDFVISYTGDKELLIYREINGEYRNLLIDEDGDVAYVFIPQDRRNTSNEFHPFMMVNAAALASKL